MLLPFISKLLIKTQLNHVLDLLRTQLLDQLRFPDSNIMQNIVQIQRFPCSHQRLDIGAEIFISIRVDQLLEFWTLADIIKSTFIALK